MKASRYNIMSVCSVLIFSVLFCGCEKYDEVPPVKETTSNRTYYINPPTAMTAAETAEYNKIVAEYETATKK